jgi:hypothetical protein
MAAVVSGHFMYCTCIGAENEDQNGVLGLFDPTDRRGPSTKEGKQNTPSHTKYRPFRET